MIAALFVDRRGVYAGMDGVDLWDEARDARRYEGPWPVVAHPPCQRWGQLFWSDGSTEPGQDGGLFKSALASVERWGGVLEHPAKSFAWQKFSIRKPPVDGGWVRAMFRPGWTCHVEQGHYGHPAPKATWLYYVGAAEPPPLRWGPSGAMARVNVSTVAKRRVMARRAGVSYEEWNAMHPEMKKSERHLTPIDFALALLAMARGAR